jgi:hypothetical protein
MEAPPTPQRLDAFPAIIQQRLHRPVNPPLLRFAPVAAGELCLRVACTTRFLRVVSAAAITWAGVWIFVGWWQFSCWGRCGFPSWDSAGASACLEASARTNHGVALVREAFVDSFLTALLTSVSLQHLIITGVRRGSLPLVMADAFPRGRLLRALFPACRVRGKPATRHDHAHNVAAALSIALVWGGLWGGLSLALWGVAQLASGGAQLCVHPWTFIAMRASWMAIEAACVASGSYALWSTRGEADDAAFRTAPLDLGGNSSSSLGAGGFASLSCLAVKPIGPLREPLASPTHSSPTPTNSSPTASFVAVD